MNQAEIKKQIQINKVAKLLHSDKGQENLEIHSYGTVTGRCSVSQQNKSNIPSSGGNL